jgi:hypothetical protein
MARSLGTKYNKTDNKIKKASKWAFSGFTIFFITTLFFMAVHDTYTGNSSQTAEFCGKYGFLASPGCWE